MKYYYSFFRDTNTEVDPEGQLYKVVIKTKKGDGMEELLLSGSPFTVNYVASDDIYKPLKCSTATVGILNRELNLDFNPENLTDVEVILYKLKPNEVYNDNLKNASSDEIYFTIEWSGFATPNAYSQGYNSYYDEFQLECQDKLSTIGYLSTDSINSLTNSLTIFTLNQLLSYLGYLLNIDYIYATKNIKTQYGSFFNLAINNREIYLDNGEYRPITDCVDSILKALNLTAIQYGNSVYIINYDAITTEYSTYDYITGSISDTKIYEAEIRNVLNLENLKSSGNGTNTSLLENKTDFYVKINNEENTFVENSLDKAEIVYNNNTTTIGEWSGYINNSTLHPLFQTYNNDSGLEQHEYYQYYTYNKGVNDGVYNNFNYTAIRRLHIPDRVNIYDIYKLNEIRTVLYAYDSLGSRKTYNNGDFKIYSTNSSVVSCNKDVFAAPIEITSVECEDLNPNEIRVRANKNIKKGFMIFHPFIADANVPNPDYTSQFPKASTDYINASSDRNFNAKFECIRLITPRLCMTQREELHLGFDMTFFADYSVLNSANNFNFQPGFYQSVNKVFLAIQFVADNGNTYLLQDGGNYRVLSTPLSSFTGNDLVEATTNFSRGDEFFNKTFKLTDNKKLMWGEENDNYFTIPSILSTSSDPNELISGYFNISIFRTWGVTDQAKTFSTLINNITLTLNKVTSNEDLNVFYKDNNVDKELSYIKPKSSSFISFKDKINEEININTTDYSDVSQLNTLMSTRTGFGEVYHREVDLIYNLATGNICTPMELVINSYKNQYLTPTLVLNTQVHNDSKLNMLSKITYSRFPDKSFIVNSMSIDYGYNSCDVQLIEKK